MRFASFVSLSRVSFDRLHARRDVEHEALEELGLAVVAVDDLAVLRQPADRAVAVLDRVLDDVRAPRGDRGVELDVGAAAVLGQDQVVEDHRRSP